MSVTLPCENCRQPIDLKNDHWTRRRVRGRLVQVCAKCAKKLDAERELEQELATRGVA